MDKSIVVSHDKSFNNDVDDDDEDDVSISVDLPGPENNLANVLTDDDPESRTPRCLDASVVRTRPSGAS